MIDWPSVLGALAKRRPVFHSEADFQHELAWEIRTIYASQNPQLRLEYPRAGVGTVDVWLRMGGLTYAVELKYKKTSLDHHWESERFNFNHDGAHPLTRYDCFHDWSRVQLACSHGANHGYAVFLTNDPLYWKQEAQGASKVFSMHEGRKVTKGTSHWSPECGKFVKARPKPIILLADSVLHWKTYSSIVERGAEFRYLLHEFSPTALDAP